MQAPRQPTEADPARKGLGGVFLVFGAMCCAMMAAAALYAMGRIRTVVPAEAWSQIYAGHYVSTLICGAAYLGLDWKRTGRVPGRAVMEFAIGMFVYSAAFLGVGFLLLYQLLPAWAALAPGVFMVWYGWLLSTGRPVPGLVRRGKSEL